MTPQQQLDDEMPQDSWTHVIRDIQARQMALVELGVAKGMFTEQEFHLAFIQADRRIEEEKTKRIDQRNAALAAKLQNNLRDIYNTAKATVPEGQIDIFRNETSDVVGNVGTIFMRVVTTEFAGQSAGDRFNLFLRSCGPLIRRLGENVTPIFLTPEEKSTSAASLQFDMMIDAQGLNKRDE